MVGIGTDIEAGPLVSSKLSRRPEHLGQGDQPPARQGPRGPGRDFTYSTAETVVEKGDIIVVTGKPQAAEAFTDLP